MKSISQYVRDQFPAIYKDTGEDFVSFVEAYYEYMETFHSANRDNLDAINVDETLPQYIKFFKSTYLKNFPYVSATDPKFVIKNIRDFYSSKGTELSTELLLKMLFGENSSTYYPGLDVLKPSDSKWYQPIYIEVSHSPRNATFVDKQIIGSKSSSRAIVEGVVTKRVNGKYVDVMYLSALQGNFSTGESVSDDGIMKGAPIVIGSLSEVIVTNGGRNNKVGDIFDVNFENGRQGKVRVSETEDATGRVDFNILDGGSGYTVTNRTSIYVSDGVLFLNNPDQDFIDFETVSQKMETLSLLAVENLEPYLKPGLVLNGINENGQQTGSGTIISADVGSESGVGVASVKMMINSGTFNSQNRITTTSATAFSIGEVVEEESVVNLTLGGVSGSLAVGSRLEQMKTTEYGTMRATVTINGITSGPFVVGETIYQNNLSGQMSASGKIIEVAPSYIKIRSIQSFAAPGVIETGRRIYGMTSGANANVTLYTPDLSANLYTNFAFGTITAVDGNLVTVSSAWGQFEIGLGVFIKNSSGVQIGSGSIDALEQIETGARATISSIINPTTIIVQNIFGQFNTARKIRGAKSSKIGTISTIGNDGATDVVFAGDMSANAVIDTIANTSASGIVIGQNISSIGIHGNTNPFFSSGDVVIEDSLRVVSNISIWQGNTINVEVDTIHQYAVNDTLIVSIDLQQNNEVKYLKNLYKVVSVPNNRTVRIIVDQSFTDIIRNGNFSLFPSTVQKTIEVNIKTDRSDLISPPRDASGNIVEIDRPIISISTGAGASFTIGQIENAETVFIDTDVIGGNNVVGVKYPMININGSGSGIGFIDSVIVTDGGSGYANGQIMTFTGGGYADGDPTSPAQGIISTNAAGSIIDITITDPGYGFWSTPTPVWPGGNSSATIEVLGDFGYGFPKSPNGDSDSHLQDLWTNEEFTIGTIASLTNINPGKNYNTDPFVRVYNSFIAGFGRTDFLITVGAAATTFVKGESISQSIEGDGGVVDYAKGFVIATTENQIIVRRTSFNTGFVSNVPISGVQSGATADVQFVAEIEDSRVMGDNATIEGKVVAANGIATKLEVIDSGYGYEHDENVMLSNESTPFVVTGIAKVSKQGMGQGFWKTFTSHLNGPAKIHDNDYYQEYSYEIISSRSLEQYATVLEELVHVAGNKLFGKVEKSSEIDLVGSQVDGHITVSTHVTSTGFWNDAYSWVDSSDFDRSLEDRYEDLFEDDNIKRSLFDSNSGTLFKDERKTEIANKPGDKIVAWSGTGGETLIAQYGAEPILCSLPEGAEVYNMAAVSNDKTHSSFTRTGMGYANDPTLMITAATDSRHYYEVTIPKPVYKDKQYTISMEVEIIREPGNYSNNAVYHLQLCPKNGFDISSYQNFNMQNYTVSTSKGCDYALNHRLGFDRATIYGVWTANANHASPVVVIGISNTHNFAGRAPKFLAKNNIGFKLINFQFHEGADIKPLQTKNGDFDVSEEDKFSRNYLSFAGAKSMLSETDRLTDEAKSISASTVNKYNVDDQTTGETFSSYAPGLLVNPGANGIILVKGPSYFVSGFVYDKLSGSVASSAVANQYREFYKLNSKRIYASIPGKEFECGLSGVSWHRELFDDVDVGDDKLTSSRYSLGDPVSSSGLVSMFSIVTSPGDLTLDKSNEIDDFINLNKR